MTTACRRARQLAPLAAVLALAALVFLPLGNVAHAQAPPEEVVLVNAADGPVEPQEGRAVRRKAHLRPAPGGPVLRDKAPGDR